MCNRSCLEFGASHLAPDEVCGKRVLEVGARDVNGSLRSLLESMNPDRYLGVDIEGGAGVDELCDIGNLADRYGEVTYDVVVCTEVVEHVREWRKAVSNLKRVLRAGGVLLLTTRSRGFHRHSWPHDWWRYEVADMRAIFADMEIDALEPDPQLPGVFIKARKPVKDWQEADLAGVRLYSMIRHRRSPDVTDWDIRLDNLLHRVARLGFPGPLKRCVKRWLLREGA